MIAKRSSSSVLPTPEKTIFDGFIPDLRAAESSPIETTSAPHPSFLSSLRIFIFELDFTEKQIKGLLLLNKFLKLSKFNLI